MKRKRKTSKKQLKWHQKLWNHAVSAKNWLWDKLVNLKNSSVRVVSDSEFIPAAALIILGGALLWGCLTVEIAAGLAALVVGGKHLCDIIRWG